MSNRSENVLAAALLTVLGIGQPVLAESPTTQQMQDQLNALQAKVDQLEAKDTAALPGRSTNSPVGNKTNTSNAGAGVNDIVSSISSGWDGARFTFSADNGNFTLHPSVTLDVRDMVTYRTRIPARGGGETGSTGYDTQNGFDLSRARFIVDGTLFHQAGYLIQVAADQGTGLTLLDGVGSYRFGESPITVKAGQFKDPVWHERNLSEANQIAVDRSLIETVLAGGQGSRIQGGAIMYDAGRIRAQLVAHDGFNTQNTKFYDLGGVGASVTGAAGVTPMNFGFSTRAEYMLLGDRTNKFNPFNEYEQFTSLHAQQNILVVGGGADFSQAGSNDVLLHSVDVQYNAVGGLALYGAYLGTYRSIHTNQGVPAGYYYDSGFLMQAAYLIENRFEPFVRYDWTHFDPSSTIAVTGTNSHLLQELTVGANYYVFGQKLKLTVDGSWLPNGSPADADALGVLRDSAHYEFTLRTQLQLAL